ncbi:MAG: TIGR00341 family protein [Phycisphaeraceae bacterium]|nr:TIGR00341 family protein [Phycisphaeraceae bacterium]
MPARLIEIVVPYDQQHLVRKIVEHQPESRLWKSLTIDERVIFRAVVHAEDVEGVLDPLEKIITDDPRFEAVVYPLEATVPRLEKPDSDDTKSKRNRSRVSRAELYEDMGGYTYITPVFLAMAALSTVTAAIGLANDNAAVIIGAMVIAPLLGPNMALSLATTTADFKLARRAILTNAAGLGCAAVFAAAISIVLDLPVESHEVALRINPKPTDIAVALAAGVAGAFAATTGVSMSLVGVMVAVALLPPLVVSVMFLVDGNWSAAGNSGLLLVLNVVCINLAGVGTFLGQGVRPFGWDEGKRAKRIAFAVLAFWILVLLAVAGVIVYLSIIHKD